MEKMREEFEAWVKDEFDIDCATMIFGKFDGDSRERYHDKSDSDGAIIVSAMLVSWKASRAALCVDLPQPDNDSQDAYVRRLEFSLDEAGVSYK